MVVNDAKKILIVELNIFTHADRGDRMRPTCWLFSERRTQKWSQQDGVTSAV